MMLILYILITPSFSCSACWKFMWKQQIRRPLADEPMQSYPPVEHELEEESVEETSPPALTGNNEYAHSYFLAHTL